MFNEENFAAVSQAFDSAFVASIGMNYDTICAALVEVREKLLERYSGDNITQTEILKSELERRLVASLKCKTDWSVSFEIFKARKSLGFQSAIRHYLVMQLLLDTEIPSSAKIEIRKLCDEIEEELVDTRDGCCDCLLQLRSRKTHE